jgi:signal transduction histidine kinase
VALPSSITVTAQGAVAALQIVSLAAFCVIAALTLRDWLATRDRSRMYLALAIGSLAAVSLLGQAGKILGPGFARASGYVTIVVFLGSGLALLMFRDSVIPLGRRTRQLVVAAVAVTAIFELGVQVTFGKAAPKPGAFLALALFVVVWSGCVGEPSVRLWVAARGRTAVQRARMRALSLGYLGIIAILLAAIFTASLSKNPAVQIGIAMASIGIVPFLYAGFVPPAWLRRLWRQGEEHQFQQATHDLILYSADRATLCHRALEWAVRLTGADSGCIAATDGILLAVVGLADDAARLVVSAVAEAPANTVVQLGGVPPRSAMTATLAGADAAIILVGGSFTPVFGDDEAAWLRQYTALVATGLDRVRLVEVLERVNAELETNVQEITERTRQLEMANRELEAYSYTISHDLRAPLRAISGFTSILLDEHAESLSPQASGYLRRVKDNGDHMGRLVDDLLAFSRLGRQALRTQRITTRDLVDRAVAQLASEMQGRDVQLIIGDLPDCQGDPALIEQVFVNLIGNAVKYSRKREHARIEVGVLDQAAGEDPTYFVRDNGTGFDMQYAAKLFGVFQRLHRSEDYEGTGVGLAIVQRVIERHGGRIWAEAKIDQGATFYFTLKGAEEWHLATAA